MLNFLTNLWPFSWINWNDNEGTQKNSSNQGYTPHDLQQVWKRTEKACREGQYTLKGKTIQLEPYLSDCVRGTFKRTESLWRWFIELLFGKTYKPRESNTQIEVVNQDALETALTLKEMGYNPALLNPANAYKPGGGYKNGARAMEEDICRRSGLAFAIDNKKTRDSLYPMKGAELLYSPNVPIFRNGKDKNYSYMDRPIPVSMISSAAINLNKKYYPDVAYLNNVQAFLKETERRVYAQLAVAADQGNDALVLTAFGCGAFKNPPEAVAKIYKRVIESHFKNVFKKITFAVIDDHNSNGNFATFQKVLGNSFSSGKGNA